MEAPMEDKPRNKRSNAVSVPAAKLKSTIYIGPSLERGKLLHATVFRGEVPDHIKGLYEKYPKLPRLIVPVNEFAKASQRASEVGTLEYSAIQSLKERQV